DAMDQCAVVEDGKVEAAAVPGDELRDELFDAFVEAPDDVRFLPFQGKHPDALVAAQHAGNDRHLVQLRRQEIAAGLGAADLESDLCDFRVGQVGRQSVQTPDPRDVGDRFYVKSKNRRQSGNTPVERYRSPRSQTTVTMTEFFSSFEMRSATASAPPDEMPAKMPSSRAMRRANSSASAWLTLSTRSTRDFSKIFGR